MLAFFVPFIWFIATKSEPARDARMARQLELIRSAQTVDDLRPVLEEIVRRQRNDYR